MLSIKIINSKPSGRHYNHSMFISVYHDMSMHNTYRSRRRPVIYSVIVIVVVAALGYREVPKRVAQSVMYATIRYIHNICIGIYMYIDEYICMYAMYAYKINSSRELCICKRWKIGERSHTHT